MAETTVAAAGARLPEDVIPEILARLEGDASALFRCAATCRRWRALVSEPSFLRRLLPDRSFVGFFTNEWRRGEGVSFIPGPRSGLGAGRRLLSSYIPDAPDLSDWMLPLASHHGLLLVRLFPRDPGITQLAVFEPLAGTWDVLPALSPRHFLGCAILVTATDCYSSSSPSHPARACFTVLIVRRLRTVEDGERYILQSFSSGQPSWSARTKFPDHVEHSLGEATIAQTDAVVCRGGVAHWLFAESWGFHILHVNPRIGRIASTQVLAPLIPRMLHNRIRLTTTADATLLSLCTHDGDRRVEIWEQEHTSEDGDVRWLCTKVLELRLQLEGARFMCLGARSGRLVMMDRHQRVYVLDLKDGAMEEMKEEFYDPSLVAVPMEIDWPNFFMSRLRLM